MDISRYLSFSRFHQPSNSIKYVLPLSNPSKKCECLVLNISKLYDKCQSIFRILIKPGSHDSCI